MDFLIRLLCRLHNFTYFLIGQLASKRNHGVNPKHEIMRYHDFFISHVTPNDTVLDIGCGLGLVAIDVAQKAKKVVGIDILPQSIEKAKKRYTHQKNLKFIIGDATNFDFKEKFDAILLSNVLEHINSRIDFLKKISPLGEKLIIRVPMINRDWLTIYKKNIGVDWRLDNTHYTEYTLKTFSEELKQSNLSLEQYSIQFGEIWAIVKKQSYEQ